MSIEELRQWAIEETRSIADTGTLHGIDTEGLLVFADKLVNFVLNGLPAASATPTE